MSKVKTSKGAVWEGFCPWHVCKTQHARSQMTEVSVEVTCHKIMTNHGVYQELDIGMMYWNNAHSLLLSISSQPPRSLQATSCNLLSSLSLSLEQAIPNGVFNFLPTWQKIGKNWCTNLLLAHPYCMVDGVKYFRIGWQVNIEKVDHWICGWA